MPIYRLLQNCAFDPEHTKAMGTAFEQVLVVLGMKDREDPLTDIVAKKIIELAQQGIPVEQLRDRTLEALSLGEKTSPGNAGGELLNSPYHWLMRAQEARAIAADLPDGESRANMLDIAENYERLAERAQIRMKPKAG